MSLFSLAKWPLWGKIGLNSSLLVSKRRSLRRRLFQGLGWEAWSKNERISLNWNVKFSVNVRSLLHGDSQAWEWTKRGCAVFVLGGGQDSTWQNPELGLNAALTLRWAGGWIGVLLRAPPLFQYFGIRLNGLGRLCGRICIHGTRLKWFTVKRAKYWNCFNILCAVLLFSRIPICVLQVVFFLKLVFYELQESLFHNRSMHGKKEVSSQY